MLNASHYKLAGTYQRWHDCDSPSRVPVSKTLAVEGSTQVGKRRELLTLRCQNASADGCTLMNTWAKQVGLGGL